MSSDQPTKNQSDSNSNNNQSNNIGELKNSAKEVVRRLFNERPDELLLQELKVVYDRQWELKDSLERKANNIVIISGIITSLLFGFTSFQFSGNNSNNIFQIHHPDYVIWLIIVSIVSSAVAVLLSVLSLRIKPYQFLLVEMNEDDLTQLRIRTKPEVIDRLIKDYHESIKYNTKENKSKTRLVRIANWFLFAAIANIPLVLGISQSPI